MADPIGVPPKRARIVISLEADVQHRLAEAAAKRGLTIRAYLLEAVEQQLRRDLDAETERSLALDLSADPVLAELWDNPRDAAYDRL
jgi:hypothetical protein